MKQPRLSPAFAVRHGLPPVGLHFLGDRQNGRFFAVKIHPPHPLPPIGWRGDDFQARGRPKPGHERLRGHQTWISSEILSYFTVGVVLSAASYRSTGTAVDNRPVSLGRGRSSWFVPSTWLAMLLLSHPLPPIRSPKAWRPLSVSWYFCLLLRGLSGWVISMRPASSAGRR